MSILSAEQSSPLPLSPDDQLILRGALPMLKALRDKTQILSGRLPADMDIFPSQDACILPYYMNRFDYPDLGVWKVVVGDMQARLQSTPTFEGPVVFNFEVKTEDKVLREATQEEGRQLTAVVKFISENYQE
jgi:hypothetical protein